VVWPTGARLRLNTPKGESGYRIHAPWERGSRRLLWCSRNLCRVLKPVWPAIAAAISLTGVGAALAVNHLTGWAITAFVGAVGIAGGYTWLDRRWRRSTQRMVQWLIDAAQYGTKHIQNAHDHDITNAGDVPRLTARHARWVETIKAHADMYLQASDADYLGWLHSFPAMDMQAFNAEHSRIRVWTSVRVQRLREVARRLQDGQTSLKRYRP
jgi:hypothetical protein